MTKQCTKCKSSFPISDFTKSKSRKDGLCAWCKPCTKASQDARRERLTDSERESQKDYQKAYRQNNLPAIKAYRKNHYQENRETYIAEAKAWAVENGDRRLDVCKRYRESNPDSLCTTRKNYRQRNLANPAYLAKRAASELLHRVLRLTGAKKNDRACKILGYSHDDLIAHLEKQFVPGMSWANHGEWHIDHAISVSELITLGVTDPKEINALKNLRPLWAFDNMKKHARFELCHSDVEFIKAKRA